MTRDFFISDRINVARQLLAHFYPFLTFVFQGPESRRERNERECLRMEIRSQKKVEEKSSSRKDEHGEACMPPLFEKESK